MLRESFRLAFGIALGVGQLSARINTSTTLHPLVINATASNLAGLLRQVGVGTKAQADEEAQPLEGPHWKLIELGGVNVSVGADGKEPTLMLDAQGKRLSGSGGCNRLIGAYERHGASIHLTPTGLTRMACPEAVMKQELAFLDALGKTTSYRIAGRTLELLDVERVLARFEPELSEPERAVAGPSPISTAARQPLEQFKDPDLLSFDELVTLSSTPNPSGTLSEKLSALLTTPFVHVNEVTSQAAPHRPEVQGLGPVLRVTLWNIERGVNFDLIRSALSDPAEFERTAEPNNKLTDQKKKSVELQLRTLKDADLLVLNEVDLGMKRTEYRDVARELASALQMNYVYGVEFVELDPIFDLGAEQVHLPDTQQDQRLQQDLQVDRERYRGLHGTAILSRYPIRNARIFRFPVCYDWYGEEAKAASKLEKGRRWSAHKLFRERIERELRHGGRMAVIADVEIPELPTGQATIVAAHLENKCPPACRRKQMEALLADLKQEKNPVVLAGDLNTTSKNNTPTSIRNEIKSRVTDYKFWVGQAVSYFHPLGIFKFTLVPVRYFHGYNDPTAFHLPILWDNDERPLFKTLENFRFADGRSFDFRGFRENTLPPRGRTLADSNGRTSKGFVPTYAFTRDFAGLVGRFKLDWVFVKPFIQNPRGKAQSYFFAPHFAITMSELNEFVVDRVSDHPPMTVDLPLRDSKSSP